MAVPVTLIYTFVCHGVLSGSDVAAATLVDNGLEF